MQGSGAGIAAAQAVANAGADAVVAGNYGPNAFQALAAGGLQLFSGVFGTVELVGTFRWLDRLRQGPVLAQGRGMLLAMFLVGWLMLAVLLLWPRYFFPFLWASVYFLLEPLNIWLGNRSLLRHTALGDWRPVVALSIGCLICGFFWEMWNFYCYPKWEYEVPFVGFLHVFEMPLLGYLGYIVFSWELSALYHLAEGVRKREDKLGFLLVCPE